MATLTIREARVTEVCVRCQRECSTFTVENTPVCLACGPGFVVQHRRSPGASPDTIRFRRWMRQVSRPL